jgi:LysM repeat protein
LSLIQNNTLIGSAPPVTVTTQVLGAILGSTDESRTEIIEYDVKSGDTLSSIAESFDITLATLLWANDLTKSSTIREGQILIIPPVDGVIYHVKSGDTISEVAENYKAVADDIVAFNELSSSADIYVGDILVIPGGTMPANTTISSTIAQVPIASSYFICPITSPCRVTQGLHWYNAVDFSHGKCGDSILAAAGGVVSYIKYGWNGGAGNTIGILHPNGVVTSYGHIQAALVSVGEKVYQGQVIALMGGDTNTQGVGAGISTGCHVHFAVHGGTNPFANYVVGDIIK